MNSLDLIDKLVDESEKSQSVSYLQHTWNNVWNDTSSKRYSALRFFKTVDKINTLKQLGVEFQGKNILDIGCGDGTTLVYLKKKFNIKGCGIDISQDVIEKNKSDYKDIENLQFNIGDHRETGIFDNSFDIVLSWGVVEHMDDYGKALNEAKRVLKPGGKLVMIQPNLYSFGVIQEMYLKLTRRWRYGNQINFSYSYLRKFLKALGFKNIVIYAKAPYKDMPICHIADWIVNKIFKYWGHYLYIISTK